MPDVQAIAVVFGDRRLLPITPLNVGDRFKSLGSFVSAQKTEHFWLFRVSGDHGLVWGQLDFQPAEKEGAWLFVQAQLGFGAGRLQNATTGELMDQVVVSVARPDGDPG